MASAILMQDRMICHKDTLSIDFGQRKWTMLHGSKVEFVIGSIVYNPLDKFEPYMFLETRFVGLMNITNDLRSPQFNNVGVALALA